MRYKVKEILLLIFSTALSLYLAWIILVVYIFSYWHGPNTRFDLELGWSTIPSHTGTKKGHVFTTNSLGFRSEEVDYSRDHILMVGDSVTWGSYVGNEEHVAYLLGKYFKKYQVLNLGVSGYGIDQEFLFLKRNIEELNPKLIIVIICTNNDKMNTISNESYRKSKPLYTVAKTIYDQYSGKAELVDPDHLTLKSRKMSKYSCINLLFYFQFLGNDLCSKKTLGEKEAAYVMTGLIKKLKSLADKHHSKLLFVLSPSRSDFKENPRELHKLEYFKRLLDLTSSEYFNFFKYIKKQNLNVEEVFFDYNHYTPLGNKLFAQAISGYVNSRGYSLPPGRK
jgi:lysophospholipase L1-like esterase